MSDEVNQSGVLKTVDYDRNEEGHSPSELNETHISTIKEINMESTILTDSKSMLFEEEQGLPIVHDQNNEQKYLNSIFFDPVVRDDVFNSPLYQVGEYLQSKGVSG